MGPCQGGFCAYRAACIRHEVVDDTPDHTIELLSAFVERRFGGVKPLLWGHNLRQALLAEHIYGRILGLSNADPLPTPPTNAGRGSVNAVGFMRKSRRGARPVRPYKNADRRRRCAVSPD